MLVGVLGWYHFCVFVGRCAGLFLGTNITDIYNGINV